MSGVSTKRSGSRCQMYTTMPARHSACIKVSTEGLRPAPGRRSRPGGSGLWSARSLSPRPMVLGAKPDAELEAFVERWQPGRTIDPRRDMATP